MRAEGCGAGNGDLILASSNRHKARELSALFAPRRVIAYTDVIGAIEIDEIGASFKENALIKARAVFAALKDERAIVIADDSGICVNALGGAPGIFSARFAGAGAGDEENLNKLIREISALGLKSARANYAAAIAVVSRYGEMTTHGFLYGEALIEARGKNGFGYDPIFVPEGFNSTIAEMSDAEKSAISHRAGAVKLAKKLL